MCFYHVFSCHVFSLQYILSFQPMKQKWPSSEVRTTVSIKQIPKVPGDHSILLYSAPVCLRSKVRHTWTDRRTKMIHHVARFCAAVYNHLVLILAYVCHFISLKKKLLMLVFIVLYAQ